MTTHITLDPTESDTQAVPATPAYQQIAALLADCNEMPTGAHLYEAKITDQVIGYVWARAVDWALYQLAQGVPLQRAASNDTYSEGFNVARQEALARAQALRPTWNITITDPDLDSVIAAVNVFPSAPATTADAIYRKGYLAGQRDGAEDALEDLERVVSGLAGAKKRR